MKRSLSMKAKLVTYALILVAVLSLPTGCRTEVYSFQKVNGQHYLVLKDAAKYEPKIPENMCIVTVGPEIKFSSMDEFVDRVTNQKLNEQELKSLARFARNENGIKVCDFSNLCRPVLPQGLPSSKFIWSGEIYTVAFGNNGGQSGYFNCMTEERYNAEFKYYYEDLFSRSQITVTERETVDDRNAEVTYYTTRSGRFKRIRYSFLHEGSEYIIDESYCLYMYDNSFGLATSYTVPSQITIYIKNDKHYGRVYLSDPPVRPEVSWLKQFRLTPYIDPLLLWTGISTGVLLLAGTSAFFIIKAKRKASVTVEES